MKMRMRNVVGIVVAVAAPVTVLLAAVPHSFSPNTVISSSQMNENFAALQAQLDALRAAPVWTNGDLLNGWTEYGNGYNAPSFTKDALGFVHLRGLVKRAATPTNTTVFVLPVGFRPRAILEAPAACSGNIPCELIIPVNGQLYFETGDPGWDSFEGVVFEAAPAAP